jgi:hypothetical protein
MKMLTGGLWTTKIRVKSSIVEGHMKMLTGGLWKTKEKDQSESRLL